MNRRSISKALLGAVLLSIFPVITGSTPGANAANLSTTQAATACASAVTDSSTAKLDVRIDGNYCVLSFLSGTNTWTPPTGVTQIEYLAIGGGGGGGGNRGGGGGAGGFLTDTVTVSSQLSITVGNGGAGAVNTSNGSNGETSTITFGSTTIRAFGGGGGGAPFSAALSSPAKSGGSGGGAGVFASSGTSNDDIGYAGGSGTSGQGSNGGSSGGKSGNNGSDSSYSYKGTSTLAWDLIRNTAGGGGAGGAGIAGRGGSRTSGTLSEVTAVTPNGGAGKASNITGTSLVYAAGGGGAAGRFEATSESNNYYTAGAGSGGSNIGGNGSGITGTVGGAGTPNTGSGGGGGGNSYINASDKGVCGSDGDEACNGGAGGSGIVIIRFLKFLDNASECNTGVSNQSSTLFSYSIFEGDCILTFQSDTATSSATNSWTVPAGVTDARMLLVGGGGGGGNDVGGGGGGGQVLETTSVTITPNSTISIYIGKGGNNGGAKYNNATLPAQTGGTNGESTTVSINSVKINAYGGGGAWGRDIGSNTYTPNWYSSSWRTDGNGSWTQGGYGYGHTSAITDAIGGSISSFTTLGGKAADSTAANTNGNNAGGGGGSSGPGKNASTNYNSGRGGDGGPGTFTSITGFSQCFGGGGGGGTSFNQYLSAQQSAMIYFPPGVGQCGGGNGLSASSTTGQNASPSTGSGGGGAAETYANGGQGASGIVIIRFTLKTSNQPSQNLNMACHSYNTPTGTTAAVTAGYFGSPFTTDTQTTDFAFPTSSGTDVSQDWGGSGPAGCSSSGDYYTLYISGYIQWTGSSETVWFAMNSDDGARLMIDGSTRVEAVSDRGFGNGIYAASNGMSLTRNSWHYVQIWLHENTGAAALNLYWQAGSTAQPGSWTLVPRANISRTVPRTLNFDTSTVSSGVLSATVDTSTSVRGGPNATSTLMSSGGTFAFYESGTVISGCGAVVSVNGRAQCNLSTVPNAASKQYYRIEFTPELSSSASDIQHNVYTRTLWTEIVTLGKAKNAKLFIGQYIAFTGLSTYPLNVYGDGTIYGAITRSLIDSGTANCQFDASKFFITASRVGSCTVSASAAGDATHFAETTTATIYWIQWSDAYATRVASTPTEIVLQHQTQITKYNFDTLTVTSYKNGSGTTVTEISAGSQLRIIGDGFNPSDNTTEVVFGNAEIVDMTYSTPALQVVSDGSGGYYLLVTVPSAAITDAVIVNSRKGTAAGPILTILSP